MFTEHRKGYGARMKRRALKRVTASIAAALLSVTTVFSGSELSNVFSSTIYAAEDVGKKGTVVSQDGDAFYDFRDNTIITGETDGSKDLVYGNLTVKAVAGGTFKLNGAQHGIQVNAGNNIEIKVNGPSKIIVGDCQYSGLASLTMTDADGTYTQTAEAKKGCYHQDESAMVFNYTEEEATTLTLKLEATMYIPCIEVVAMTKTYNFCDNSIITADTDGSKDLVYGSLTVKAVTGGNIRLNTSDVNHGMEIHAGNNIEIKVNGPSKITVGDCLYHNTDSLTITDADGSYTQTVAVKKGCWHNDGSAAVFEYTEEEPTTLTLKLEAKMYIPMIKVAAITEEKPDDNGAIKDTIYDYNFSDGSVLAASYDSANQLNGSVTSKDGFLTLTSAGTMYTHDTQHGLAILKGDTFDVKVAGDATITFHLCEYGADEAGVIKASSKKGKFEEDTKSIISHKNDGLSTMSFTYTGVATTLTFKVGGTDGAEYYMHGMSVSNKPAATENPELVGNGKVDVWDFGGEQLDDTKYNNKLSVDTINSIYPDDVVKGSTGATIGSFSFEELVFRYGGRTNARIRTANEAITRYDTRNPITVEGTTLTGYVYSNNASPTAYVGLKAYPNDIITLYMGSNGGASTIYFESPSGKIQSAESAVEGRKLTFYATEYGEYKIYSINEKLVLYRAERTHTQPVVVSGSIDTTAASSIGAYALKFKCTQTGESVQAEPNNGTYSVYLNENYDYTVSLVNANGFVIESATDLSIPNASGAKTFDIKIKAVDLVTVTGKVTGLSEEALNKVQLSFVNTDKIYIPEYQITGDDITINLEKGVEYKIVADGINDYALKDISTIKADANGSQNIDFIAKPVYDVKMSFEGLSEAAKASAVVTFSNINEEGYNYTFNTSDAIKLRDGQYSVKVSGVGSEAVIQGITSNVKVNGKAVEKKVSFKPLSNWDFAVYNAGNPGIETIGEDKYYLGLQLSKANVAENKTYLLVNPAGTDQAGNPTEAGSVKVPVKKDDIVTISYCYCAGFSINGEVDVYSNSGSTSLIESTQYIAKEDGFVTLTAKPGKNADDTDNKGQTYFTSIVVNPSIPYAEKVTVGADKQFKTINEAIEYVSKMQRTEEQRVQIVIDPGNYEEMLRIKIPNISLVNAAGKQSSIQLTNKGVDIAENVVRITSYYGHGYNYYSMGADSLYSEDVKKANQENGYLSNVNTGSGTTNNSYWNATVVVYANGFEADGIVFENSFNQYISAKEAADTVVCWETGSKGVRSTTVGDVSVQAKSFVERAAAIAILGNKAAFNKCKFIGRQDTLYGGADTKAVFEKCDILGGTDYIFGGMIAVFNRCNLVMNTSEAGTDVAYITATQQAGGRGYLMYECNITSTTPGVDTASATRSKPGYFGRPWAGNTSEAVFYNTTIETTDFPGSEGKSLIVPEGWNNSLGGPSPFMYEYGSKELSGEDNSSKRASWAQVLTEPKLDDGKTDITYEAFLDSDTDKWTDELRSRGYLKNQEPVYCDVNGDGVKNIIDAVVLKKYIAQMKGYDIIEENSDLNDDEKIDVADAVILLKYLARVEEYVNKFDK